MAKLDGEDKSGRSRVDKGLYIYNETARSIIRF